MEYLYRVPCNVRRTWCSNLSPFRRENTRRSKIRVWAHTVCDYKDKNMPREKAKKMERSLQYNWRICQNEPHEKRRLSSCGPRLYPTSFQHRSGTCTQEKRKKKRTRNNETTTPSSPLEPFLLQTAEAFRLMCLSFSASDYFCRGLLVSQECTRSRPILCDNSPCARSHRLHGCWALDPCSFARRFFTILQVLSYESRR